MMKLASVLLLLAVGAFASEHGEQTDIIERTVNFILFVALAWYLLAEKVKTIFTQRTAAIATALEKLQERLKEAKNLRAQAQAKYEEAVVTAEDLVKTARKEGAMLAARIEEMTAEEIRLMDKHFDEMVHTQTKMKTREVVAEEMASLFGEETLAMSPEQFAAKLTKKAA